MRQKTNLRLQKKYNRLFKKLQQALQSGQFLTYSSAKKTKLLNRLQSYENRFLRKGFAVLGTAALLMNGGEIFAQQPVRVGEEFLVNSFTSDNQRISDIAMDDEGNFVIIWQSQSQDGSSYGIYGQLYKSDGMLNGEEFQINTYTLSNQDNPSVSMDNDGDFVVVWESGSSLYGTQDGSGSGIYGQKYTKEGIPNGSEFRINTITQNDQSQPDVAISDEGDFVVCWLSNRKVYAQRFDTEGNFLDTEFRVATFSDLSQNAPNVTMDNDGDFVVIWVSPDDSFSGVFGQLYDKNGVSKGDGFQVNTNTLFGQYDPSLAMDSDGDFVVTWTSQYNNNFDIFGQRFSKGGIKLGSEFQISSFQTNQSSSDISMDDDGDFIVCWDSSRQDGYGYGIYAQSYYKNGEKNGEEFLVNTITYFEQVLPSVALDNDGDFVITWTSDLALGDIQGTGVSAQRYKIPTPTIPDINTLILNTCTRPYSVSFDPVPDAIGYQVQITVLARNREIITRRIAENEISGNFNIPRRLLGTDVEIQIAAIFIDDETGEEVIREFSESGTFTLGCDEADNLILESRNRTLNAIQLSPNPVQSQLQVQVQSEVTSSTEIKILNLDGKVLLEQNHQLFEGQNELYFNVEQLPVGQYFLQIQTAEGIEHKKFVKQ